MRKKTVINKIEPSIIQERRTTAVTENKWSRLAWLMSLPESVDHSRQKVTWKLTRVLTECHVSHLKSCPKVAQKLPKSCSKVSKSCKNSTWWATNSTIYMGTTSTMTMEMVLMRLIRAIFTQDMAACWAHNPVSSTHSIIHLVRWEVSWHSARVTFKTLKIRLLKVYKVSIEEFHLAKVIN